MDSHHEATDSLFDVSDIGEYPSTAKEEDDGSMSSTTMKVEVRLTLVAYYEYILLYMWLMCLNIANWLDL